MPRRRRYDPWSDGRTDPGAAGEGAANARTILLYAKSRAEARKAMLTLVDTYEKRVTQNRREAERVMGKEFVANLEETERRKG